MHGQRLWDEGGWPADAPPPPSFAKLVGIELRSRVARLAQQALGPAVEVLSSDARTVMPREADAVLFFDVLHMMPVEDQEQMIATASNALLPGGLADPGSRSRRRLGFRLCGLATAQGVRGQLAPTVSLPTMDAWASLVPARPAVAVRPMSEARLSPSPVHGVRSADRLRGLSPDIDDRRTGAPVAGSNCLRTSVHGR